MGEVRRGDGVVLALPVFTGTALALALDALSRPGCRWCPCDRSQDRFRGFDRSLAAGVVDLVEGAEAPAQGHACLERLPAADLRGRRGGRVSRERTCALRRRVRTVLLRDVALGLPVTDECRAPAVVLKADSRMLASTNSRPRGCSTPLAPLHHSGILRVGKAAQGSSIRPICVQAPSGAS